MQAFTTELDIIRHSKNNAKPNQDNIIDNSEHETNDINNNKNDIKVIKNTNKPQPIPIINISESV